MHHGQKKTEPVKKRKYLSAIFQLMNSQRILLFFSFLLFIGLTPARAQDELLKQLQAESKTVKHQPVLATFKGNKIINVQTNETVKKHNLDVRINHLFGNMGAESGGSVHNLYGIDQSNDIRLALHYGITDRLMVGVSRSKRHENLEGLAKFRLLEQTTDNRVPLAITLYANTTYTTESPELVDKQIHRLTYCAQAILARKFSRRISLAVIPSFLHRNLVEYWDKTDVFSLGGGMRFKFTRSASVILDYFHTFRDDNPVEKHYDTFGAGIEVETGGHVFSIMFTNASGILENDFLVNTTDSWAKGGYKFSFIISRMFHLGKKE
jgi:hypothetical protein